MSLFLNIMHINAQQIIQSCRATRGFTLIELLVVIVIIGILATSLIPKVMGGPAKARDVARISQLNQLATIMQSYYTDYGVFPADTDGDCLDPSTGMAKILVDNGYADLSNFPRDPNRDATIGTCTAGWFHYKSLTRNNLANQAFMVASRVENAGRANAVFNDLSSDDAIEEVLTHLNPTTAPTMLNGAYVVTGG